MFKSLSISSLGSLTASWLDANSRSACSPQHQCPSYRLLNFWTATTRSRNVGPQKYPWTWASLASEKKPVALRRWNVHRNCAQHLKAIAWVNTLNQSKIHQNYIHYKRKNIDQFTVEMTSFWDILSIRPGKLWKINLGTWKSPNYAEENHLPNSKPKPGMLGFSWSFIGICWDFRKAINLDGSPVIYHISMPRKSKPTKLWPLVG